MFELGVLAGNSTEPRSAGIHARGAGRGWVYQGLRWGDRGERWVIPLLQDSNVVDDRLITSVHSPSGPSSSGRERAFVS